MTIDERVAAFMEAQKFEWTTAGWLNKNLDWPIILSPPQARFMYCLHLESMKEETQGTKEWTLLPIIARDLDSTALLVMRTAADKRIAKLDKLIAEAQ